MKRPAYIERKIAEERARREADRTHALPCDCPFHITRERIDELAAAALARNGDPGEEIPF